MVIYILPNNCTKRMGGSGTSSWRLTLKETFSVAGCDALADCLPSFHFVHHVHNWICVVCSVPEEEVLHETVFSICMDTCCFTHCCVTKLFHYLQYFPWNDLVHRSCFHDCHQWCYGIHVWLLPWQDSVDSTQPKEDLGRLYRRRHFYHFPGNACEYRVAWVLNFVLFWIMEASVVETKY